MTKNRMLSAAAITSLLSCVGAVQAQIPWVPPSGAGTFFTYTGGLSDNGLFGNPILVGDTFQFTPSNFQVTVNGVSAQTVTDRIQVDLTANVGHRFTQIRIHEIGGWSIIGAGTVNAFGSLQAVDFVQPRVQQVALQTTPNMPLSAPANGLWNGDAVIDFTQILGADWTHLRLVFSNTLGASGSTANSTVHIDKKVVSGPSIFVDIVPAPGSGALLAVGGLFAARRRRR